MTLSRSIPSTLLLLASPVVAQPATVVDLAAFPPAPGLLTRVYGATGDGRLGVPVAGGHDLDGDGFRDLAVAYFLADPMGRVDAGEVDVVFGDGTIGGVVDTALDDPRVLRIFGAVVRETAGNEIWMDDVTGDGVGDLLIGRQNFTPDSRIGAGALTIVVGSPALRRLAADLTPFDLADPPAGVTVATLVGANQLDRLGIWVRTGDVTGDGVADVVVGADQEDGEGEANRGAVYVIRGGAHLAGAGTIELADFGATALAGRLARITPPPDSDRYHLGSTCQIADLDGNGRAEVLASAALARGGASVHAGGAPGGSAEARGGAPRGSLYVLWDDNFPAAEWTPGYTVDLADPPGARSVLHGGERNETFGEEVLGGRDYDGDGTADLFVGDFLGATDEVDVERPGVGYVFFDAAALRDREFDVDAVPASLAVTTIVGPSSGSLGADTAADGDIDGDGVADLVFASPYASPLGRTRAGAAHVLFGRAVWPLLVDLSPGNVPHPDELRVAEIRAAHGDGVTGGAADGGDTLGYSAAAADHDGDGRADLVINEMKGNGVASDAIDVGNLIVVGAAAVAPGCVPSPTALCLQERRFRLEIEWRDFNGATGPGRVVPAGTGDSGLFWFFAADNWEVLVKVLDGCRINGRFWVFAAATTNVGYTLRVTDTLASESRAYVNTLGVAAPAITDTGAFATCP